MIRETKENAYAKINLFLEVRGKREDGYHLIDSVMHTVSLCDRIAVSYDSEGEGIVLTCDKKYIPTDGSNIAAKCARQFLSYIGLSGGVTIGIEKRIPVAAGLGGGSSDGAAVLRALNALTGARLDDRALSGIAAQVGADIPFLVRGGCMRAEGIGEALTPIEMKRKMEFVVAIGGRGSQTPAAYRALDEEGYTGARDAGAMIEALRTGDAREVSVCLYNAFEGAVFKTNREAKTLREEMSALGAAGALMSGSGASVFGIFKDARSARRACAILRKKGYFAVSAQSVGEISENG